MKLTLISFAVIAALIIGICCVNETAPEHSKASYVGTDKCISCHKAEYELFSNSDHFHAMDTVSDKTVLGNFNNAIFIYHDDTTFFYKEGKRFFVKTTDSTGHKKVFEIAYTFGWKPLQQYLVQFSDGRIQALPFCWDTREAAKGGQKWFHIYNKEKIGFKDELFWMGMNQNWNYMCADCHTTDYAINFDVTSNSFKSKWKESCVSCESCHGPASEHIAWADHKNTSELYKGFAISLASKKTNWKMDAAKQTLLPEQVIMNDTLIETCARCHAKATRFSDAYFHGQSLFQTHLPVTADLDNYYSDGQIKEENYEYGSFLQSKMYAAGVTCNNCHNPHSGKIKITGNALCGSCHAPAKYDGPQHSFHAVNTTGNQCVSCHMPTTNYMVIDARLDHSIRIPRPDLSLTTGNPNACNQCHTNKTVQWAATHFKKQYGSRLPKTPVYGELMHQVNNYSPNAVHSLYNLLSTAAYPDIIKATAMEQFGTYNSNRIYQQAIQYLSSKHPALRIAAIKAIGNHPSSELATYIPPLLYDPVVSVRFQAMFTLSVNYESLEKKDQQQFDAVKAAYFKVQENMSHRPDGFFNRAVVLNNMGSLKEAENLYKSCIARFPRFISAYVNLIELYRQQNNQQSAKIIIDQGLEQQPNNALLQYVLGLWHVGNNDYLQALKALKKAADTEPANATFVYGYAIGIFSVGDKKEAIGLLEKYLNRYGNNPVILNGLISMNSDMGNAAKANAYTRLKKSVFGAGI